MSCLKMIIFLGFLKSETEWERRFYDCQNRIKHVETNKQTKESKAKLTPQKNPNKQGNMQVCLWYFFPNNH